MRTFRLSIPVLALAASVYSAVVKDVSWLCNDAGCSVAFRFQGKDQLPSFYQKYDAQKKVLRVAFANTSALKPLGNFAADSSSPWIRSVTLAMDKTSSGVPLLVMDFAAGQKLVGDKNPTALQETNLFVITLGEKPSSGKTRKLSALKPPQPVVVAATTVDVSSVDVQAKPVKAQSEEPAVKAEAVASGKSEAPASRTAETSVKDASAVVTGSQQKFPSPLSSLGWSRGFGMELIAFGVEGDTAAVTLTAFPDSIVVSTRATVIPGGSVDRKTVESSLIATGAIARPKNGLWTVTVQLRKGVKPTAFRRGRLIVVQMAVPQTSAMESWKTGNPVTRVSLAPENGSDSNALENKWKTAGSSSAKQVFFLQSLSRVVQASVDSLVLRAEPDDSAKIVAKIGKGTKLALLKSEDVWCQVRASQGTGWARRAGIDMGESATKDTLATGVPVPMDSLDSNSVSFERVEGEKITYSSFGRRDPFIDLKGPANEGVNIDGVELVGIIWDAENPMALLSDLKNPGISYTIKEGDKIQNGKVLKISPEEIVFLIHEFGISRRYTMSLPDRTGGKR